MRELHVVAVSEDGRHVLLAPRKNSPRGEFRVALDDRLAAALRGDLPRPGERTPPNLELSPKEIQARLRAGESIEQIAASAGVPVARVDRYAGPVLSEREGIIIAAQRAVLARSRRGLSGLPLGEAVAQHLSEAAGYKPESTTWTARREQSGRWVVQLSFVTRAKTRTAAWRYDPATRELTALDAGSTVLGHVEPTNGQRAAAGLRSSAVRSITAVRSAAGRADGSPAERSSALGKPATRAPAKRAPVKRAASAPAARATGAKVPTEQALSVTRVAAPGRPVPGRTVSAPGARRTTSGADSAAPPTPEVTVAAEDPAGAADVTSADVTSAEVTAVEVSAVEVAVEVTAVEVTAVEVTAVEVTAVEVTAVEVTAAPAEAAPSAHTGPPMLRVVPSPVAPGAPPAPADPADPAAAHPADPADSRPTEPDPASTDAAPTTEPTTKPTTEPTTKPAPAPRPARRAAGARASVPAWADVLLGIAPVESARDRDQAQD